MTRLDQSRYPSFTLIIGLLFSFASLSRYIRGENKSLKWDIGSRLVFEMLVAVAHWAIRHIKFMHGFDTLVGIWYPSEPDTKHHVRVDNQLTHIDLLITGVVRTSHPCITNHPA